MLTLVEDGGVIRLPEHDDEDDDGEDEMTSTRRYARLKSILLSWNAWLAVTLIAGLGVLIWSLSENCQGRPLNVQAGLGALFLAVDW